MTTAYALAHLKNPTTNEEVLDYIERIQATMDPFGGRFIAHGPPVDVREGEWPGTVVVLEFPSLDQATGWYESDAYQAILPQRTRHIDGTAIIFEGVDPGYDAAATAARFRAAS